MKQNPKILICGGGTGGHVFPALAIANAVKEMSPGSSFLFIGANGRIEMKKVPEAGYDIIGLNISGLQRKLTAGNLMFPFRLVGSLIRSGRIISKYKPDVVVGVGGYSSGPPLWVASRRKIPTLIQEQNSYPGITNKLLGSRVNHVCVAYEGMERFFPSRSIVMTGNPVRKEVVQIEGKKNEAVSAFGLDPDRKTLLVVGGSLGARTINNSIRTGIGSLVENGIQVIWQTGRYYFEEIRTSTGSMKLTGVVVKDFIDRMDLAYAAADLVISRAGAIAISELCATGKATVLVPSPNVAEDHQTRNAEALVKKNAAILVKNAEAPDSLTRVVLELFKDENRRAMLSINIKALARMDAASRIAEKVLELSESNQSKR